MSAAAVNMRASLSEMVATIMRGRAQLRDAERQIAQARAAYPTVETPDAAVADAREALRAIEENLVGTVAFVALTDALTSGQVDALLRFARRDGEAPALGATAGPVDVRVIEQPPREPVEIIRDRNGLITGTRPA